jgi:hypothetical protein
MVKALSRQRLWQIAQVKKGNCMLCKRKRKNYAVYCDECRMKENVRRARLRKREAETAA